MYARDPRGLWHPRAGEDALGWDECLICDILNQPLRLSICVTYVVGDTTCDCGFIL